MSNEISYVINNVTINIILLDSIVNQLYNKCVTKSTKKDISIKTGISLYAVKKHFYKESYPTSIQFIQYLKLLNDSTINSYIEKMDSKEKMKEFFKNCRNEHGLSINAVAKATGLSTSTIKATEDGKVPNLKTFLIYYAYYETTSLKYILEVLDCKAYIS